MFPNSSYEVISANKKYIYIKITNLKTQKTFIQKLLYKDWENMWVSIESYDQGYETFN